ncbi:hypothetical protein P175DRAFT_0499103 [Aspergillus ochraceoroseus IBT 24754]|uniref:Uncharacterized protein n=1 Tax=Aspergillus ochraceoroseus IBT 24754 TaxID=1392256 RepID=A0A2T5M233_9EURO|nr:uncharacterized protein P175DRAFT_0499103 [Aspergillus ochraceoroseus IBT 24754]PTU22581.1 hypothetical protein P175DRAFT_0499103 [Aspergillus ochraceoroseus IBT 24754]
MDYTPELHGYVSQLRNLKGETILGLLITAKRYSHSLRPWKVSSSIPSSCSMNSS